MAKGRRYNNAFEAVGFDHVEAEHLRIRADLMLEVERTVVIHSPVLISKQPSQLTAARAEAVAR